MPVVELAGVTKAYEDKVAVSNLSLSIDAGQMFGLLGPNGAGKSARAWSAWATCRRSADSIKR